MAVSNVYYTNMRTTLQENLLQKLERLVKKAGMMDMDLSLIHISQQHDREDGTDGTEGHQAETAAPALPGAPHGGQAHAQGHDKGNRDGSCGHAAGVKSHGQKSPGTKAVRRNSTP